jgi:plastocyanin
MTALRYAVMLVAAPALLGAATAPPRAPATYTVVIDKMKFGAVPANARVGDTILWVNRDMFRHTATARDGSFDIDLPPAKAGKTVLKRAGTVAFWCKFHPGMKGQIVIAP